MVSVQSKASLLYRGEALAPMVRASTIPLRTLALKYGADFVYTEELVDHSLIECQRVVNEQLGTIDFVKDTSRMSAKQQRKLGGRPALILRIDPQQEQQRLVCQLGTGEPQSAVEAALRVHRDVQSIDVNMGCPKNFSVSGGMGSALLEDPERASRIIRSLCDAVSSSNSSNPIPVSAKIRLLKDTTSTLEFASTLIDAGANAIAIHGRRPGDRDIEAADWKTLEEVVSLLTKKFPHIPFLINGDFYTRDEFAEFRRKTGAAGVLLARPALYNTSIFRKPANNNITGPFGYDSSLLLDRTAVIQDYLREALRYEAYHKNVKYVVCEMMGVRRTPTERARFLRQKFPGRQSIQAVCRCSTLTEICAIWNVETTTTAQQPAVLQDDAALPGEHTYLDSYNLRNGMAENSILPQKHAAASDGLETEERKKIRLQEAQCND